ncbi:MAG: hypothetical protein IPL26_01980 [Leptospiraceae bacterium]|nr:hypothetical protein [Leptospiraceae bacterium]
MALSGDKVVELQKLQRLLSLLEKTFAASKNEEQKKRVSKDIQKYKSMILTISPDGIPDNIHNATVYQQNTSHPVDSNQSTLSHSQSNANILSNIAIMKISPHSHDSEINFIATLINVMETEYVPILGESHTKFDFSHATERDTVMKHLENIRRTMKVLTETIEEYALSEKQDFKEQLGRMKNKQSRIFISEAGDVFKVFKDFLEKVQNDMESGGVVVMNLGEKLHFNPRFERATMLEGKDVGYALRQFAEFTKAALESVHVPTLKK